MSDTVSINETQRGEAEITLPPLESGEVRVTDEAFGPVINLTAEPLHTKEITRAVQMFVKDNYLITNNSRDDSIPKEKGICDLSIPGLKGSWTTYIGDFGVNDLHGRLAFAYKYFKRLRIVDPSNMVQRETIFDSQNLSKGQNDIQTLEPTNITHFWGMSPGENHFWMLYSGRTPVDVQRDNRSNNKYIYVEKYDWNGNPVKKYRLDDWGYFCVDEKNETLYLSSTASVFSILKYDLTGQPEPENPGFK